MSKDESLVKVGADLKAEALAYPKAARELTVTNDRELADAHGIVKAIKALKKEIRDGYDEIVKKTREAWLKACAKRDHYLKPLDEAERIVKDKMAPYMEEQARRVREAEEAARRAEEEAEAAQRAAEEERQRKAREALQDGDTREAEKILEKPAPEIVPEKVDIPETQKLEGTYTRTDWMWELENIDLVPRMLPNGERPLKLDRGVITAYVQKHKDKANIPGIRAFSKTNVATRE